MNIAGLSLQELAVLPISIAAFVVLLSIIVFIHEYGHFSVARALGVRVEVFSIGFGRPLASWVDKHGTEWRVAWIPIGGYVKFFGDANAASQAPAETVEQQRAPSPLRTEFPQPGDDAPDGMSAEERAVCFHYKPVWARAAIVAAGPVFNFILAVVIFASLFMTLGRYEIDAVIGAVGKDTPSEQAGFIAGDRILSVDGRKLEQFNPLYDMVMLSGGEEMVFVVEREGEELTIPVTPRRVEEKDRFGNDIEVWKIGMGPDRKAYTFQRDNPFAAVANGVHELWRVLTVTVRFLGRVVSGQEDLSQLAGPIKMAQYAGQSVISGFNASSYESDPGLLTMMRVSLVNFISLAAVVSVSIGFLNLLPIPVLDGGHLVYYAYETVAGKPLGARAQAVGYSIGLVIMATLMVFVTWNDISSLISSIS